MTFRLWFFRRGGIIIVSDLYSDTYVADGLREVDVLRVDCLTDDRTRVSDDSGSFS